MVPTLAPGMTTPRLDLRFRVPTPELLTLPWRERLAAWDATEVAVRDIPVGPSRHLVRFVEADGRLWALKEMPLRVALHEYEVLRELERRSLSAVRAAGLVVQPLPDTAILVTHFLDRSWQYRRLLMRVPTSMRRHRERLLDAIATLLVDLIRRKAPEARVDAFSFRAQSPLFDGNAMSVNAGPPGADGKVKLWAANATGGLAVSAEATVSGPLPSMSCKLVTPTRRASASAARIDSATSWVDGAGTRRETRFMALSRRTPLGSFVPGKR